LSSSLPSANAPRISEENVDDWLQSKIKCLQPN
jgi:hypothetical protein